MSHIEHPNERGINPPSTLADRLSPEDAIKANEALARCIFESDSVGLILCDARGTIREANDAFLHMIQRSHEDIAAGEVSWQGITPPEFLARDTEAGREVAVHGCCAPIEKQYFRRDGTRLDVLVMASRVYDIEEIYVLCLVFDITTHKRAREILATNAFLDSLLEHIPGIIFVKDAQTLRYVLFNKNAEKLMGQPREELLGKNDYDLFPKEQADRFVALDRQVLASRETIELTDDHVTMKRAGLRILHSKKLTICDDADVPRYILGISEDVTEKRQTEAERLALIRAQAAREEAEKIAARLRILSHAGALLASSLKYQTTVNNLAQAIVPALADWCAISLQTPAGEVRRVVAASDRFDEMLSYACVPLKLRGETLGSMCLMTTKHSGRSYDDNDRQLIEELAHRAALAVDNVRLYQTSQNLNRLKDEFLAVLSHELRTPLSVIQGFTDILKNEGIKLTDKERQDYYDIIARNSESQTRIVTDLLDVSSIITGKMSFTPQRVVPADVINEVLRNLAPSFTAKGLYVQFETTAAPAAIMADPMRFQQIVWNLVSNALKFTPKGGTITLTLSEQQERCRLEVSDTGAGFDPEFVPYIFDRFRQEDGTVTRKFGGLGLGLAIARHIVELHGGQIKAESEGKGQGAKFTVTLPLSTS